MHTFADCLHDFHINGSSTTIISVVFKFLIADNAVGALKSRKRKGRSASDPRDNGTGIERQYGRVRVYIVGV